MWVNSKGFHKTVRTFRLAWALYVRLYEVPFSHELAHICSNWTEKNPSLYQLNNIEWPSLKIIFETQDCKKKLSMHSVSLNTETFFSKKKKTKKKKKKIHVHYIKWTSSWENLSLGFPTRWLKPGCSASEIQQVRYYTIQSENNKDADQTARMCRLICTFVVHMT